MATKNLCEGSSVVRHAWKLGLGGNASECLIRLFEHFVDEDALGVDVTLKCVFVKQSVAIVMMKNVETFFQRVFLRQGHEVLPAEK